MTRFLGDTPLRVAIRLLLLSLLVGWLLSAVDLTPRDLLDWTVARVEGLIDLGFRGFGQFGETILVGAAVVVPVFLLARVLSYRRG